MNGSRSLRQEDVFAVIPAHNEAAAIEAVVRGAWRWCGTVMVVDDGSDDGTGEAAAAAGAHVIRVEGQGGKGSAVRRGLEEALKRGCRGVFLLDGDGQHDPEEMGRFLDEARRHPEAVLVGDRMAAGACGMPWLRRRVNRVMSWWLGLLTGRSLPDSQCGYRHIPRSAIEGFLPESRHFEMETEMILKWARAGIQVIFVPVACRYHPGRRSRIRPLQDALRWAVFLIQDAASRKVFKKPAT